MRTKRSPAADAAVFWSQVDKSDECWLWTGACYTSGYGRFKDGAHRFSWTLANGQIPNPLWVLHRCDNPPCVRPDHLFLGTPKANAEDMIAKGRAGYHKNKARGATHWRVKLTDADVEFIRRVYPSLTGRERVQLAADLGVDRTQVWRVARGLRRLNAD